MPCEDGCGAVKSYSYEVGWTNINEFSIQRALIVDNYKIGDLSFSNTLLCEAMRIYSCRPNFKAHISLAALSNYYVIIDGPKEQIYFMENKNKLEYIYNRTGVGFHENENKVVLATVAEGSPAHTAGLINGDILVSINGVEFSTNIDKIRKFNELAYTKETNKIILNIKRDQADIEVILIPENYLDKR